MEMTSSTCGIGAEPRRLGPFRLRGFGISGWVASLFRRLTWKCQDRRTATSLHGLSSAGGVDGFYKHVSAADKC